MFHVNRHGEKRVRVCTVSLTKQSVCNMYVCWVCAVVPLSLVWMLSHLLCNTHMRVSVLFYCGVPQTPSFDKTKHCGKLIFVVPT